ncbi:hypothetical protein [Streptomyces sp. NBC_01431]|uniref:hypothetical protein n=1 Tax=Streptomyces sp. NBC_01431 TaxID=2903863 RepID=UPI002E2F8E58|nr:hypothetical protein [Streptomyces sp. NBC_01431]
MRTTKPHPVKGRPEKEPVDPSPSGFCEPTGSGAAPPGPAGNDDFTASEGAADDQAPQENASDPEPRRRRARRVLGLVATSALLLAAGGLLFAARQLEDSPGLANHALSDTGATTRVIGDVSNTLGKVFSYAPQDTSSTQDAGRELLGGRAAGQYAALFGELRQRVAEQKLTLTTHVVRAGVTRLTRDRAELLVFLDQRAQRAGKPATTAAAQLSITAQLTGGNWQITDIQAR